MSKHARWKILLLAAFACTGWCGCRALVGGDALLEVDVPARRLHRIDTLDLDVLPAGEQEADIRLPGGTPPLRRPSAELEMTLAECRAVALRSNLGLQVELINPAIAREAIAEQQARFEPSLFANSTYARTETPTSTTLDASEIKYLIADVGVRLPLRTGGTLTFDLPVSRTETNNVFSTLNPSYTSDFGVSLSQPLLRDGGIRANTHAIRIAHYQSQIVEARTKLEVIRVIGAVDRVYWRLYAARKELEVRKNEYDLAVAQLERVRRMAKAGAVPEVEIIRAETGVAERVESIIVADNDLRDRERELKRVLNKPGLEISALTILIPATDPRPVRYALDVGRITESAVANRMEMLELELQIAQDASTIDFQRNQALPVLALDYTYGINGLGPTMHDSIDLLLDRRFDDHRLGLQFVLPLGNRAAESRLRQAIYTRVQRLATRERRQLQIQEEVANAADRLEANWQRILASRQRTILAARNLEAEQRQFELGLRTSTDVLDAQTRLADAKLAEIRAQVEYQIAQVDLAFATGTLLGEAAVVWQPIVLAAD